MVSQWAYILISGICIVISSRFSLLFYHILFDLLSIILFYALVSDFLLILGSNEHPSQIGIEDRQNGAKRQKHIFSHTKTRELLRSLVKAATDHSRWSPICPHLKLPSSNVRGMLQPLVAIVTGRSKEARESLQICFVSLIRLILC